MTQCHTTGILVDKVDDLICEFERQLVGDQKLLCSIVRVLAIVVRQLEFWGTVLEVDIEYMVVFFAIVELLLT